MAKLTREDKLWIAEKRAMQKQFNNIIGWENPIPIRDVPKDRDLWSYTSSEPAMYLSRECALTEGLTEMQKRRIRYGLFVLEMSVAQFTDFPYSSSISSRLSIEESVVFQALSTVIEKGAARRFAHTYIGGSPLTALKSMLKRADAVLPKMVDTESQFQELMVAMLHIAYTETIKGTFKTKEVKEMMKDVYSLIISAIDCGDPATRMDMTLAIMEKTKPIWIAATDVEKYSSFKGKRAYMTSLLGGGIASALGTTGFSASKVILDDESEEDDDPIDDDTDFSIGAKRESTWNKINSSEEDEDEDIEEDEKHSSKSKNNRNGGKASGSKNGASGCEYEYDDEAEIDLSTGAEEDAVDEEQEIGCDKYLDDLIRRELEIDNVDLSSTSKTAIPDFQEVSKRYTEKDYKCKNILVTPKDPAKNYEVYSEIVEQYASSIKKSYKELDKIFKDESSEEEYRTSGKISMKKLASGKVSSKLFTKKKEPDDRSSIALMILVDESGSMWSGGRIERAKTAAIGISEVFSKLDIPVYVMGFTADTEGADAVHYHYLQWHTKSKMDRAAIASMDAKSNNFDGYSIRVASTILSKRPEKHKILMVISDGQPAASAYSNVGFGISDTIDAINDARAVGQSVLGFGIGSDVEILKKFYQDDFVYINHVEDLFKGMMTKLTNMVKSW